MADGGAGGGGGGVVRYSDGVTSGPGVLSVDIDDSDGVIPGLVDGDGVVMNGTGDAGNLTTPCTNDYCVSDEAYLDMIEEYVKPSVFEWILIGLYFIVFVSIINIIHDRIRCAKVVLVLGS